MIAAGSLRFIPRGRNRSPRAETGSLAAPQLLAREPALLAWTEMARPGERLAYHAGHLALDRVRGWSSLADGAREELGRVANLALVLAEEGRVLLAQRRLDDGRIAYLAIRTMKPPVRKETTP
jgi:hypothetical protein